MSVRASVCDNKIIYSARGFGWIVPRNSRCLCDTPRPRVAAYMRPHVPNALCRMHSSLARTSVGEYVRAACVCACSRCMSEFSSVSMREKSMREGCVVCRRMSRRRKYIGYTELGARVVAMIL